MPAPVSIGQRFAQLIQHLGLSKNAFAQSLGKTATVIQHLVDERNKPGYDLLCKVFEVYPNVSKDWLLLGQGPMLLNSEARNDGAIATASKPATQATTAAPPPPAPASEAAATPASAAAPVSPAPVAEAAAPTPTEPAPSISVPPVAPVATATPALLPAASSPGPAAPPAPTEAYLTAALHAQHLQHQLALAEQRNQHLLEQQRLMQQLLDLAQRR